MREAPGSDLVGAGVAGGYRGVEASLGEFGTQGGGGRVVPQVVHLPGVGLEVVQFAVVCYPVRFLRADRQRHRSND